jgi:hypothetical protein
MRRVNELLSNVEVVMRTVSLVLLSGVAVAAVTPSLAADFDPDVAPRYEAPYVPPPPPAPAPTYNTPYVPPPAYEPRVHGGYYPPPAPAPRPVAAEECRSYVKSRVDEWGREVQRRVRVCEDVVGAAPHYAPPRYYAPSYAPPPYAAAPYAAAPYAAAPYAAVPAPVYVDDPYDRAPRPPADVGVNYYYR